MPSVRASFPPLQRRRLASGSEVLDFVHTGGVGSWLAAELVHEPPDLERWLGVVLERPVVAHPGDVAAAHELREALWQLTRRHLAGRTYRQADVDLVNTTARGESLPLVLDVRGGRLDASATAAQALTHLAREAVLLFSGPLRERIRECASPTCQLLFVDSSRPGRRQWCSMQRCGNLRKVRAYRERTAPAVVPGTT